MIFEARSVKYLQLPQFLDEVQKEKEVVIVESSNDGYFTVVWKAKYVNRT